MKVVKIEPSNFNIHVNDMDDRAIGKVVSDGYNKYLGRYAMLIKNHGVGNQCVNTMIFLDGGDYFSWFSDEAPQIYVEVLPKGSLIMIEV